MTTKTVALPREHKALPIYVVNTDEALGIVEAVVNVFGILDLGKDVIQNGAYTKTLNERGNQVRVKVLDSHNTDSVMRVIGKPLEIREVGRDELAMLAPQVLIDHPKATGGLLTRTQYALDTPEGSGVFKRIAGGYVTEYSIALDALDVEYGAYVDAEGKTITGVRYIKSIRLWEYSPVVFGMNQATVTTDIKTSEAPEGDKADPAPTDEKRGSLSAKLEANMRMGYAYCVNDWLACGMIDAETITILDGALGAGMNAFRSAVPPPIADAEIEYYAADGSGERKAGRVISARNVQVIQQAIDALQALLDAVTPAEDETLTDEKAIGGIVPPPVTGSGETQPLPSNDHAPTTPSITDAAEIDRELAELDVMMEMSA